MSIIVKSKHYFQTRNPIHMAEMIKEAGDTPAYGNQRSKWGAGSRFDY